MVFFVALIELCWLKCLGLRTRCLINNAELKDEKKVCVRVGMGAFSGRAWSSRVSDVPQRRRTVVFQS